MGIWKDLLRFATTPNPDKTVGKHGKTGKHAAPPQEKICGISDDTDDIVHKHHVCGNKRGHLGKHLCRSWEMGCDHQW